MMGVTNCPLRNISKLSLGSTRIVVLEGQLEGDYQLSGNHNSSLNFEVIIQLTLNSSSLNVRTHFFVVKNSNCSVMNLKFGMLFCSKQTA